MSKMVRLSMVVWLMVLAVSGCNKGKTPRRLYEKSGGFSINPPEGWEIVDFPGLKYKVAFGTKEGEFTPNINVVDEKFQGTLEAYADANIETLKEMIPSLRIISRETLKTEDDEPLLKMVIENEQNGHQLRQMIVFAGSGSRKYVITCTALAEGKDKFDGHFLESVKTFRLH